MTKLKTLRDNLRAVLDETFILTEALGELTLEVPVGQWVSVCQRLRTDPDLHFETCIDLCGVDYLYWGNAPRAGGEVRPAVDARSGPENRSSVESRAGVESRSATEDRPATRGPRYRFAVVVHALSLKHNWRLRLRTGLPNDEFPVVASLMECWPAVGWFEREAFDLFGIIFEGHPDLRRILTDYGFIGHPFRKDFPLSGNVEMRYDSDEGRVIYQPVTIDPREITPRIVREDTYGVEP